MESSRRAPNIVYADLTGEASTYTSLITKEVQKLEDICREQVPRTLSQRRAEGPAFLTKAEIQRLLEWKLKHGKYRPNLLKLLASNSDKDVENTTKHAFEVYLKDSSDFTEALEILAKLKGIGPATASLILSRFDKETVPFFSDELFRWMLFEDGRAKGWDRKISYSSKDYLSLYSKVFDLRTRLNKESGQRVLAEDVEKAAYVISKKRTLDTADAQAKAPIKELRDRTSRKHRRESEEDVPALAISIADTTKRGRKRRKP